MNIPAESKLDEISERLFAVAQEYWDEYHKQVGTDAVIWIRDIETKQFICYTRGEYSKELIETINELR